MSIEISYMRNAINDLIVNPLEDYDALRSKYAWRASYWKQIPIFGQILNGFFDCNSTKAPICEPLANEANPKLDATIWKLKQAIDANKKAIFSDCQIVRSLIQLSVVFKKSIVRFRQDPTDPYFNEPSTSDDSRFRNIEEKIQSTSVKTQRLYRKILLFETYVYENSSVCLLPNGQTLPHIFKNEFEWKYYIKKAVRNKNVHLCKSCWAQRDKLKIELSTFEPIDLFKISCLLDDPKIFAYSFSLLKLDDLKRILQQEHFSLESYFDQPTADGFIVKFEDGLSTKQYSLSLKVLAARSDYFLPYFYKRFSDNSSIIQVEDCSSVEQVLRFIYSGKIMINLENWKSIYSLSQYLCISELTNQCTQWAQNNQIDPSTNEGFSLWREDLLPYLPEWVYGSADIIKTPHNFLFLSEVLQKLGPVIIEKCAEKEKKQFLQILSRQFKGIINGNCPTVQILKQGISHPIMGKAVEFPTHIKLIFVFFEERIDQFNCFLENESKISKEEFFLQFNPLKKVAENWQILLDISHKPILDYDDSLALCTCSINLPQFNDGIYTQYPSITRSLQLIVRNIAKNVIEKQYDSTSEAYRNFCNKLKIEILPPQTVQICIEQHVLEVVESFKKEISDLFQIIQGGLSPVLNKSILDKFFSHLEKEIAVFNTAMELAHQDFGLQFQKITLQNLMVQFSDLQEMIQIMGKIEEMILIDEIDLKISLLNDIAKQLLPFEETRIIWEKYPRLEVAIERIIGTLTQAAFSNYRFEMVRTTQNESKFASDQQRQAAITNAAQLLSLKLGHKNFDVVIEPDVSNDRLFAESLARRIRDED
ncbi:MAG: BTB/POZ domain-containing protein [Parachlamydiaceae bacterium]|nr:BTB/POZ domain-containing protein [Parachlamydiaceae bacterium]